VDVTLEEAVVELDETRHFNRYRLNTLRASVYKKLTAFDPDSYRRYCIQHEPVCLKDASKPLGYWTSPSSEREFGPSNTPGNLDQPGSARWKQRAFYDFIKDLAPIALGVHLVRLSVWDELVDRHHSLTVGRALHQIGRRVPETDRWSEAILALVQTRLA
jgi:hypothetical protein